MDLGSVTSFFAAVPTDWILVAIAAVLFMVDAIRVGAGRVAALGFAAVFAVLASAALQKAAFLGAISTQFATPVLQAVLFGVLLVLLFLLVRRITIDYSEMGGQPIQALFAGGAVAALVLVAWVQIPALSSVWNFGPQIHAVFGEAYRFWWLIGSFAALAFARNA